MITVTRSSHNPILKPDRTKAWESQAVFNGCPVRHGGKIFLLYRALSFPHYHTEAGVQLSVSDIGRAESEDGFHFTKRTPFIVPKEHWERFGCEDPRVTFFEGRYYIFYTALSVYPFAPEGIRVGVAISDDLATVKEKHLVTPFNAKAMALFPGRVNGKICAILTAHTDMPPTSIGIALFDRPEDLWSREFWQQWEKTIPDHAVPLLRNPLDQIEVGAPPLKTKDGWLIIYSYIRGYRTPKPLFGIEAALLDLDDPTKIVARTDLPLMVPEEEYELYGIVPKIIFPSGILEEKKNVLIYYSAADTTCCVASVNLEELIRFTKDTFEARKNEFQVRFERAPENPILAPDPGRPWETKAVFNPAAILIDGRVHLLYRAMGNDNTSVLGHASSRDGIHFDDRDPSPAYVPRASFEMKLVPNGNSGCEDPRITRIDDTIYMCYTAFDGRHSPQVALTSILVDKFLKKQWEWAPPVIISPSAFDDKDACIFPEKVGENYIIFHRIGDNIDIAFTPTLDFTGETTLEEQQWLERRDGFWDGRKVGVAAPPIKTDKGWILIYHGVSESSGIYRVGAALLDLKDPSKIIGRTDYPLFEPQMPYEKNGQVANVVFPCGNVLMGDRIFIYYGGADTVVGVASIEVASLLRALT